MMTVHACCRSVTQAS